MFDAYFLGVMGLWEASNELSIVDNVKYFNNSFIKQYCE